MGNSLNEDITNKHVILKKKYYNGEVLDRVFFAKGGFGCSPDTMGCSVFGILESRGLECRVGGDEIERFATNEEVEESKRLLVENRTYYI